jgi:hypothetical protein
LGWSDTNYVKNVQAEHNITEAQKDFIKEVNAYKIIAHKNSEGENSPVYTDLLKEQFKMEVHLLCQLV